MAFWSWSKTAGTNATADSTINWAEGQSPSSVNDSARAMMARTAEWRDDIAGATQTGGTSTAYTLTTNQIFDTLAHMANMVVAFTAHATCGDSPTLSVDGLTAKPIRSASGASIPAGTLVAFSVYRATYFNGSGEFVLHDFYGTPYGVPVGGLMPYIGSSAPSANFVLPFGQAINRTTYSTLFSLISTTFGVGNGTTTFNVPDLRGRTIFGLDNMGGSAASLITVAGGNFDGTAIGTAGGAQNKTIAQANLPAATLTTTITDPGHTHGLTNVQQGTATGSAQRNADGQVGPPAAVVSNTNSATTGITASTALGGSGTALAILPPSMVLPFILRVI